MSIEKMSPINSVSHYSRSSSSENMSHHMSPPLNPHNITHIFENSSRSSLNSEENLLRTQNTSKKLSHFSEKALPIKKIVSQPSIPTGFKLENLKGDDEKNIDQITIELQPTALLSPDSNKGRDETVNMENYKKKEQSPRKLHRKITMKVPNNYFVSDNSSENDDRNFGEIIENDLNFNYKVFFQFFLMHSLFYFVLGPFSAIFIAMIWGGHLARNQFFWGFNSELIVQTTEYLIIFTVLFLYYFYNFSNIFMIEIYMVMAAVFLRISIISIKYATMNEDKVKLMKTKEIPHEDLKSEFTLRHFKEINDLEIEKELQTTIIRKDIDVALLLFRFLGEVNPEIKQQIQSDFNPFQEQQRQLTYKSEKSEEKRSINELTLITNSPSKKSLNGSSNNFLTSSKVGKRVNLLNGVNIIDEDMKTVYSGYLLTQLIIKKGYQQGMKAKWFVLIGIIVSFTHAAIPSCYRLYSKGFLFGDEFVERFLVIALFLINFYLFFMNFSFLLFGIFEFGRQLRSLNQLSHLMASKKLSQLEDEKFTPTIDFFCKLSLKSWGSLHKIIRNFGAKYKLRIECYLTLFSLFYLMITILIISAIFGNLETLYSFINLIILIYEVLIMSLCMIALISIGVVINKQYQIHKGLIKTNKDILSDLLRLYIVYFEKKGYKPENEVYRKGVEKINQNVNYYLSNSISICNPKKWVHDELRKKVTKRVLKDLISICDEIIEELTFENLYEPFKINGIAATPKVLHSIFAIFGSLLFAVGQKYLKNYL